MLAKAAAKTTELVAVGRASPHDPASFQEYFNRLYSAMNDTGDGFVRTLHKDVPAVPFRSAAQQFQLIDDTAQRPVLVRYGDSERWIDQLRFAGPTRDIMRHLQRYTVNLPRPMVDAMLADGRLQVVDSRKAPDIVVQACMRYDDGQGLDVYADRLPVEDLMV
jgi:CRISPR-associated endonuclease/helicase Cas3